MMKISVIVAAYNVQEYIVRCLASLHNQEMRDVEFIIVDDGSTDSTGKRIQDYIEKTLDTRFKYLVKENGGLSDARNYGVDHAIGEYVWYIDGDDYIVSDKNILSKFYECASRECLEALFFNYQYDNSWPAKYASELALPLRDTKVQMGIEFFNTREFSFSAWHVLLNRSFLVKNRIKFLYGSTAEDLEYIAQVLMIAKKVKYISTVGYEYFYRENSITKSTSKNKVVKRIKDVISVTKKIDEKLRKKGIKDANVLVSGYIAQVLTAFATGYVTPTRKEMCVFFKGKKLSLKENVKRVILVYLPSRLRAYLCKKIIL